MDYGHIMVNGKQNTIMGIVCQREVILHKNKKARVLPRLFSGGGARIRTLEGVSQQIYSLPSLTA